MFDDYVEHTGTTPDSRARGMPQLGFQGFEPSPYNDLNDNRGELISQIETGYFPATGMTGHEEPIFSLSRVQYTPPAQVVDMRVCNGLLVLLLANNSFVLIRLAEDDNIITIPAPRKPSELRLTRLFLDPSGRHVAATSAQGENYHIYIPPTAPGARVSAPTPKPRQLKNFKMVIESIAWGRAPTTSRDILLLIGGNNGTIFEARLDGGDEFFKQQSTSQSVYRLSEAQAITGLHFDFGTTGHIIVFATTANRMYTFVGASEKKDDGRMFGALFSAYSDMPPKIMDLPGNISRSELHIYAPSSQSATPAKVLAWLTAAGVYHGTLNLASPDNPVDSANLMPFSSSMQEDPPLAVSVTEYHFLLLRKNRVCGIRTLDEHPVVEEPVPLKSGEVLRGMASDPIEKTYWAFSDASLFEISVTREARDMWKVYLDRDDYERSLQFAQVRFWKIVLAVISCAYADLSTTRDCAGGSGGCALQEGKLMQAAQSYARSSARFEEVTLKFIDANARDPLRYYLVPRLERLPKTALTQRMMLATWLVEFYLAKCNELDDLVASESVAHDVENLKAERAMVEEDLRVLFDTYKANLDRKTVYELIMSHGRTDMYLHFASVVGDHAKVVEHWVMEASWPKALEALVGQSDLPLYYRFAPVLMRHIPKDVVDAWLRVPQLDPVRLIPALLAHKRDPLVPNQAIRYLDAAIFEHSCTAPTVHTLLLTLLAAGDEAGVLRFLAKAPVDAAGKPYFDLDYALRVCGPQGRARVYAMMERWEEAVDAALGAGDVELAKAHADRPVDDAALRKRLWLKIARYVVRDKRDIKSAMRFLENTDLLKIEDILPFFPDFVIIDDFKDEICRALEGYAEHIDKLRGVMDDATAGADAIKQDIEALSRRAIGVDSGERCARCAFALLTRQFYVFPCQHSFHADCLIALNKEYLPPAALRKIVSLQTELVKTAPPPPATASQVQGQQANGNASPGSLTPSGTPNQLKQRTLLSAALLPVNAANALSRGVFNASINVANVTATGLRELIVPESLAGAITMWGPGGKSKALETGDAQVAKVEKIREELEDLLASACPLCESVVVGLDKPFLQPGEVDESWQI
ncbi:Pep3/Vps18/deep orange family-domain-containing protein [Auriculariales sp. MPI-PUGE-AT-0066]|nr:Pep3/Vps18/deep orange family-domain-containing protein [Auriculariales sp. MPI-PUGE-AT-0066]